MAREQVILLAPEPVITAADDAFRHLRAVRDRIGQGEDLAAYGPALADYASSLHVLRAAIRDDLGIPGGTPPIPL